jgi:hypothetical protein
MTLAILGQRRFQVAGGVALMGLLQQQLMRESFRKQRFTTIAADVRLHPVVLGQELNRALTRNVAVNLQTQAVHLIHATEA